MNEESGQESKPQPIAGLEFARRPDGIALEVRGKAHRELLHRMVDGVPAPVLVVVMRGLAPSIVGEEDDPLGSLEGALGPLVLVVLRRALRSVIDAQAAAWAEANPEPAEDRPAARAAGEGGQGHE